MTIVLDMLDKMHKQQSNLIELAALHQKAINLLVKKVHELEAGKKDVDKKEG